MKYISLLCLAIASVLPVSVFACLDAQQETLRSHLELYPTANGSTNHWPTERNLNIGSVISFLVPIDASIAFKDIQKGMLAPLTLLGTPSHEQIRTAANLVPHWIDIDYDAKKYKWMHIVASSFGSSEAHITSPRGWSKSIKFTLGYPSPTEVAQRPPVSITLGHGEIAPVAVDGHDNIEVTIAGTVNDGWNVSLVTETGFRLIRILQVEIIDGEPRVKLFFAGTSSPKTSTMVIQQGHGDSIKRTEFKIIALPTPTC